MKSFLRWVFLILVFLSMVGIVNAKTIWEVKEFQLTAEEEGTFSFNSIRYDDENKRFMAISPQNYKCDIQGDAEYKCNVYYISMAGEITKANLYSSYRYDDEYFYTLSLEENEENGSNYLEQSTIYYKGLIDPSKDSSDGTNTKKTINDSHKYVKLYNLGYYVELGNNKETTGFLVATDDNEDNVLEYGIILGTGEYVVEPSANYEPVFTNEESSSEFFFGGFLKDNEKNTYIITNYKNQIEILDSTFLDKYKDIITSETIHSMEIESADQKNYYSIKVRTPDNENCDYLTYFFTKDTRSPYTFCGKDSLNPDDINTVAYISTILSQKVIFVLSDDEETVYYSFDTGQKTFDGYKGFGYSDDFYWYIKDNEFIIANENSELTRIKISDYQGQYLYQPTGNKNKDMFLFILDSGVVLDQKHFEPQFFLLTKNEIEEPKEEVAAEKTTCKRIGDNFYDKDGNIVTKSEYEKSCPETPPDTGIVIPVLLVSVLLFGFIVLSKKKKPLKTV